MRIPSISLFLFAMIVSDTGAQTADLVSAERAFARAAAESSMKQAFLAYLDDSGIIFRPEASNGRQTWSAAPDGSRALLSWDPVWAEIASDGAFGYTTGPWTFRQTPEDSIVGAGSYVSVWRKDAGGNWKVLVDLGVAHERVERKGERVETSHLKRVVPSTHTVEMEKARLHSLEVELSAASLVSGYERAISPLVASDARFYRNGALPIIGRASVLERLKEEGRKIGWEIGGRDIARSVDLAYSWGGYRTADEPGADPESGNYLRIWRRSPEGEWQIALEVLAPLR